MTVVAGLEQGGRVYLGADSATVADYDIDAADEPKVFVLGEFVFGFAGSWRAGQILHYAFTPPKQATRKGDMKYLAVDVIDAVRKAFLEKGYARKDDNVESADGAAFLLGYKGRLYCIGSDYQIVRPRSGFAAIGCGDAFALGSMHGTAYSVRSPKKRVLVSLQAAASVAGADLQMAS